MKIELTVNGRSHALDVDPLRRLLDILREDLHLTGTKEGCGEGECGACAVLLDGQLVNACLVPAAQLDGRTILTIEGLGTADHPDPVQQAFMEEGAAQCGFCIPGMVLAARALLNACPHPTHQEIRRGLAGNLCRCTGYERIVRAVEVAASREIEPWPETKIRSPLSWEEVLQRLQARPGEITVLAGTTDLLTELRLGRDAPGEVIDISRLPELHGITTADGETRIGAATTFAVIANDPLVAQHLPALRDAARQLGAAAIQNRATLGGNIISASPAADAPPVLQALGARFVLARTGGEREVAATAFYTAYRETERRGDELLARIHIPIPHPATHQAFYKVGTRRAQAISKVILAGSARCDDGGLLIDVRLSAGSVAPTTIPLVETQRYLEGRAPTDEVIREAGEIASKEVVPIDDIRSTAHYRRTIIGRLVVRFLEQAPWHTPARR